MIESGVRSKSGYARACAPATKFRVSAKVEEWRFGSPSNKPGPYGLNLAPSLARRRYFCIPDFARGSAPTGGTWMTPFGREKVPPRVRISVIAAESHRLSFPAVSTLMKLIDRCILVKATPLETLASEKSCDSWRVRHLVLPPEHGQTFLFPGNCRFLSGRERLDYCRRSLIREL